MMDIATSILYRNFQSQINELIQNPPYKPTHSRPYYYGLQYTVNINSFEESELFFKIKNDPTLLINQYHENNNDTKIELKNYKTTYDKYKYTYGVRCGVIPNILMFLSKRLLTNGELPTYLEPIGTPLVIGGFFMLLPLITVDFLFTTYFYGFKHDIEFYYQIYYNKTTDDTTLPPSSLLPLEKVRVDALCAGLFNSVRIRNIQNNRFL